MLSQEKRTLLVKEQSALDWPRSNATMTSCDAHVPAQMAPAVGYAPSVKHVLAVVVYAYLNSRVTERFSDHLQTLLILRAIAL